MNKIKWLNNKKNIEVTIVSLIVLFALSIRIYGIGTTELYHDPANFAKSAEEVAKFGGNAWAIADLNPPVFTWLSAVPIGIFGLNETTARIVSSILGAFSVLLVYFLLKLWFEKRVAYCGSLLFAVTPLHVLFSRLAFSDVTQSFFLLAAILISEYTISKWEILVKKKMIIFSAFLHGVLIATAFLTKYNTLPYIGLYWILNIGWFFMKKDKKRVWELFKYGFISAIFMSLVSVIVMIITDGVYRVFYVAYNVVLFAVLQSDLVVNSFYYHLFLLFDAISPLLAIIIIPEIVFTAWSVFVKYKKENEKIARPVFIVLMMTVLYYLIITFQKRRLARHEVIIMPFVIMAVILSVYLFVKHFRDIPNSKKNRYFVFLSMAIIVFVSFWTIYEINKTEGVDVWKRMGVYMKENYPENTTLYVIANDYWPIKYYVTDNLHTGKYAVLKNGDLAVLTKIKEGENVLENSPFENNALLYRSKTDFDPEFMNFTLEHGKVEKIFYYKGEPAVWIFRMVNISNMNESIVPMDNDWGDLTKTWNFGCNVLNIGFVKGMVSHFMSEGQKESISSRCGIN